MAVKKVVVKAVLSVGSWEIEMDLKMVDYWEYETVAMTVVVKVVRLDAQMVAKMVDL